MNKTIHHLLHPREGASLVLRNYLKDCFSDKTYLQILYYLTFGKKLDLEHPKTFQEKLQWIKLYDRKPIYHTMVDKYECKEFISSRVGGGYTIPTLGIYNSFEEIEWEKLPEKFIMKATHDSGSYYLVKDKKKLNLKECKKRLCAHWNQDYYSFYREWQYKGIKPRIIVEPLLNDGKGEYLTDYKFYTFNGEPKILYITSNRGSRGGGKRELLRLVG